VKVRRLIIETKKGKKRKTYKVGDKVNKMSEGGRLQIAKQQRLRPVKTRNRQKQGLGGEGT